MSREILSNKRDLVANLYELSDKNKSCVETHRMRLQCLGQLSPIVDGTTVTGKIPICCLLPTVYSLPPAL